MSKRCAGRACSTRCCPRRGAIEDIWVARLGRLAEIKPIEEYGIEYSALVNRLRGLIPRDVAFVQSKVTDVASAPSARP